jgi:transcriptional regulator of arginine metabolism
MRRGMSNKHARQYKIKELISEQSISSQQELCDILSNSGFPTTQATLSRDLNEMGIVRVPYNKGFRYSFTKDEGGGESLRQLVGLEIINVKHNENLIMVRTISGRAKGVGVFLDHLEDSHIMGTVAGENTVLVIPDSDRHINMIVSKIQNIMQTRKK